MVKNKNFKFLLNGHKIRTKFSTDQGYENVPNHYFHYAIIEKSFINLNWKKMYMYFYSLNDFL